MPKDESRRIPDLRRERPIAIEVLFRERDVGSRRALAGESEPHRVCAESIADLERIDNVSFRLRHLLPFRIEDNSGDVHRFEWNIIHELQAKHHHSRDPKEDDVVCGDKQRCGIERLQILRLIRPSERRERPQTGAEPGVEHILILPDLAGRAFWAALNVGARNDHLPAIVAIPCRNPVAPPQLPRDAPIANIAHPLEIGVRPIGRHKFGTALFDCSYCFAGERFDLNEPLCRQQWFDHRMTALAMPHVVLERLDSSQQTPSFKIREHALPRFGEIESAVWSAFFGDSCILIDNADLRETVPLPHFEIGRIVCRRDFHDSRAEFKFYDGVFNERDLAVHQRQDHCFPFILLVALVFRIHGHGRIAQHRLRPRGRHFDKSILAGFQWILDVVQRRIDRLGNHLEVR